MQYPQSDEEYYRRYVTGSVDTTEQEKDARIAELERQLAEAEKERDVIRATWIDPATYAETMDEYAVRLSAARQSRARLVQAVRFEHSFRMINLSDANAAWEKVEALRKIVNQCPIKKQAIRNGMHRGWTLLIPTDTVLWPWIESLRDALAATEQAK